MSDVQSDLDQMTTERDNLMESLLKLREWYLARTNELEAHITWMQTVSTAQVFEIRALKATIVQLTTDLEAGFMVGAYARLQHLQEIERKYFALKVKGAE